MQRSELTGWMNHWGFRIRVKIHPRVNLRSFLWTYIKNKIWFSRAAVVQRMNQDSISWQSCHLQAARPGNDNTYLTGVNVSTETDDVCEGFGKQECHNKCASSAFQAKAAQEEKPVTHTDLHQSRVWEGQAAHTLGGGPPGCLWILTHMDFSVTLQHLFSLLRLLVPSSHGEMWVHLLSMLKLPGPPPPQALGKWFLLGPVMELAGLYSCVLPRPILSLKKKHPHSGYLWLHKISPHKPETEQDPVGLPFCVPHFLFVGNRLQSPWPSRSSKGQIQTVANQGREGMQRQRRSSQETRVQPWGRVLVPPQGIHISVSLSSSTELKPPTNGGVNYLMKQSSFQREGHSLITSRTTKAHQETTWGQIKGIQALHTPWSLSATPALTQCYKTPHQISLGWDSVWGHEPTVSSFIAWQSNKAILFYFPQNSVSEIWLDTGAQRWSFRHQT